MSVMGLHRGPSTLHRSASASEVRRIEPFYSNLSMERAGRNRETWMSLSGNRRHAHLAPRQWVSASRACTQETRNARRSSALPRSKFGARSTPGIERRAFLAEDDESVQYVAPPRSLEVGPQGPCRNGS